MNIAFTGHRDFDRNLYAEILYQRLLSLSKVRNTTFWSGMAVGFDLTAAEMVLDLRDRGARVRLCCAIPYAGQALFYSSEDMARYEAVLRRADYVETIAEGYSRDVYFRRNDFLVEHADKILAFHDGGKSGGTAYTVRRARKLSVPIENICPQQQLSLF